MQFVAPHDDLEQLFGGVRGELSHAKVVDDEQGDVPQHLHALLAIAVEDSIGTFL
ncbi:MAG: hypothetical protein AAF605_09215 [Myxococcota bacterium]